MLRFQTRWLAYPAVALVTMAIYFLNPEQLVQADGSTITTFQCDDEELNQRWEYLVDRQKIVADRMAFKELLLIELVENRATLKQVAAEFLRVNQAEESCMICIRQHFAGNTDEEKCARNVIQHVMCRNLSASQKALLDARLECDLHAMYDHPSVH